MTLYYNNINFMCESHDIHATSCKCSNISHLKAASKNRNYNGHVPHAHYAVNPETKKAAAKHITLSIQKQRKLQLKHVTLSIQKQRKQQLKHVTLSIQKQRKQQLKQDTLLIQKPGNLLLK